MADQPKPNPDLWASSLKAKMKQTRPSRALFVGGILLLFAFLAGLWYLVFSTPSPGEFGVVALDRVISAVSETRLEARLIPLEDSPPNSQWEGQEIFFKALELPKEGKARTDARGQASFPMGQEGRDVPFLIRRVFQDKHKSAGDFGTTFVWPKDAKVVLVEIESSLTISPEAALQPHASETLLSLEKQGFRIAYSAMAPEKWSEFLRLRNGLRAHVAQGLLPRGPVLLPPTGTGDKDARKETCRLLLKDFPAPLYVVTGSAEWAGKVKALAGVQVVLISDGEKREGVAQYPSWKEVQQAFAPG